MRDRKGEEEVEEEEEEEEEESCGNGNNFRSNEELIEEFDAALFILNRIILQLCRISW